MNNKNLFGLITAYVLIAMAILSPTIIAKPSILVTNYELYPSVFMPGDKGILTLAIENTEMQATTTETYGDVTDSITIVENNGVVINRIWINSAYDVNGNKIGSIEGLAGYEKLGNIAPGASFQMSFGIIAENNMTEGYYFPEVNIDLKNDINGNYEDITFPIEFRVSNETLDLLSTNVPSKISMSGSTLIALNVVNNRENDVDAVTIIAQNTNGIELIPNSVYIGKLDSYSSSEATFSVKPSEIGLKNLSFLVEFKNGNNLHDENLTIPIEIIETLDVAPVFISVPREIEKGKSSRVNLEVYNAKTESISGVIVTPITEAIVSPSQYFIGSMDAGDVFSASFQLSSGSLDNGNYTIGFKVTFRQENDYYETSTISSEFSVVPQSENQRSFSIIYPYGLIVIIIFIIMLFFFFFKKRRK